MANINNVVLVGNLTKDLELRRTQNGTAVTDLNLAINNRVGKGDNAKDEPVYIEVTVWDKQAENCAQYLSKGSSVGVVGRLKMDTWEDKDTGSKRSRIGVIASNVQFLSSKSNDESAKQEVKQEEAPVEESEIDNPPF